MNPELLTNIIKPILTYQMGVQAAAVDMQELSKKVLYITVGGSSIGLIAGLMYASAANKSVGTSAIVGLLLGAVIGVVAGTLIVEKKQVNS
jgi:hypothetical protein